MRKSFKALITVMVAVFVISALSIIVSANTKIDSGTVSNKKGSYNWEYYEDNLLVITPNETDLLIDEADLPSGYLTSSTTIHIDVSNLYNHSYLGYQYGWFNVYGDGCPTGNIEISGKTLYNFFNMTFRNFPVLSSISFQEDTSFYWIGLYDCNIEDIDIFENLDFKSLGVCGSENLITANVPDGLESVNIFDCENLKYIDSIENLESISLQNLPSLDELTIPSATTCCTLDNVGITEITVPKTCTDFTISSDSLKKATLAEGTEKIHYNMFSDCTNLEQVIIPDSVKSIEPMAFSNCENFKEISIPASIETIDETAFGYNNYIEEVYYAGTRAQWNSIKIMDSDDYSYMSIEEVFLRADIFFNEENLITKEPEDYTGKYGSTATFSVEAEGDGLVYQWQHFSYYFWYDLDLPSATTSCVEIPVTEDTANMMVRCIVTDSTGVSCTSHKAKIIAINPLTIETQPVDYSGCIGSSATFTVGATDDDITYQWQYSKDGINWKNSNSSGYDTATMTVKITEARDGQYYRCVITQGNESVESDMAAIHVLRPITISTQPADYSGKAGEYAVFSVEAEGEDLKYQWQYKTASGTWKNSNSTGSDSALLKIKITEARAGQLYRCVITDKDDNKVVSGTVSIILAVPEDIIIDQPESFEGTAGTTAVFRVGTIDGEFTYQWQYSKDGKTWKNSSSTGYDTAELKIKVTEARDGQQYRCVVKDTNGNKYVSSTASIKVLQQQSGPSISEQPKDFTGELGTTAVFTVEAEGEGLTYQWQYSKDGGNTWKNSSSAGYDTTSISIKVTEARNGQMYRCVVTSAGGSTTTDAATLFIDHQEDQVESI